MAYEGYIDHATDSAIRGWVYDDAEPNGTLAVEVLVNGQVVGEIQANAFRADLLAAGKGNGKHAFSFEWKTTSPGAPLLARIAGKRWSLPHGGQTARSPRFVADMAHSLIFGLPAVDHGFSAASASPDEPDIARRIIDAYHFTTRTDPGSRNAGADTWTVLHDVYHQQIARLLEARDARGVCDYLRDAHAKPLTHGITLGAESTAILRSDPNARAHVVAKFADQLASLAEFLGLLNLESPQQRGNWGENLHSDPDTLVDAISRKIGIPVVPPQVIGSMFGIKTRDGILCDRDLVGLYAALRLRDLARGINSDRASVCEIGGGLGGVAYYCNRLGIGQHTIIDLPIVNSLQSYYLLRALPPDQICLHGETETAATRIRVLPTYRFAATDRKFDILFNQDSFPEMHPDYSREYLRQARNNVTGLFLSINQEACAPQIKESRQTVVRELVAEVGGYRQIQRFKHWLWSGYVDELYEILPAKP